MNVTSYTSLASRPLSWAVLDRCPLTTALGEELRIETQRHSPKCKHNPFRGESHCMNISGLEGLWFLCFLCWLLATLLVSAIPSTRARWRVLASWQCPLLCRLRCLLE